MANDETRSITTSCEEEQTIIEAHEQFGWSLHSSQEIMSQVGHSTDMGYYVEHTTTTTNYVKLVFKRDRDFPNADKIRPLEDEYWDNFAMRYTVPKILPGKILKGFAILYIVGGIFRYYFEHNILDLLFAVTIGLLPTLIRYFFYYKPKAKKAELAFERCCEISESVEEINRAYSHKSLNNN